MLDNVIFRRLTSSSTAVSSVLWPSPNIPGLSLFAFKSLTYLRSTPPGLWSLASEILKSPPSIPCLTAGFGIRPSARHSYPVSRRLCRSQCPRSTLLSVCFVGCAGCMLRQQRPLDLSIFQVSISVWYPTPLNCVSIHNTNTIPNFCNALAHPSSHQHTSSHLQFSPPLTASPTRACCAPTLFTTSPVTLFPHPHIVLTAHTNISSARGVVIFATIDLKKRRNK
ncbi:hypothetical protein BDW22DRAFT_823596 [Trametopsis cervina]|nr:hypothetical protein BDW22DRAFT_823596 [Trametopsis cervina]